MDQVGLWDLELLCHPLIHLFLAPRVVPLPPCGLSLCALGQALDQWVPCLPEGQEVQEGPSPQGHLSFQVALGVLGRQELLEGQEDQKGMGHQVFFLLVPDLVYYCCWPSQVPGWVSVYFPA